MAARRILIVDDDEAIVAMLQDFLSHGYDVIVARGGYQGLAEVMVGEHKVDLVITDLNMPGLDGIELMENLPEDVPVIAISGYLDTPRFRRDMAQVKPAAVLRKLSSILRARLRPRLRSSFL